MLARLLVAHACGDLIYCRAPYVGVLTIAFAQPDSSYVAGSLSWTGTGVQFSSDATVRCAARLYHCIALQGLLFVLCR